VSAEAVWTEAAQAALDLVGRTGARQLEIGYLHEDVPAEQADWYAQVTYKGARIIEEHHTGPAKALEALAAQLLTGAMCNHCKGLVALSRDGAAFFGGAFTHGATMTIDEARARPQCLWRREGERWVRGCEKR
jgi:hypothetical protein